jgi:hypothetical protein
LRQGARRDPFRIRDRKHIRVGGRDAVAGAGRRDENRIGE